MSADTIALVERLIRTWGDVEGLDKDLQELLALVQTEGAKMTNDELDKLEAFARAASASTWQWAQTPTRSRLGAIWWMIRAIFSHKPSSLWGVMIGTPDDMRWIAVTGNGPDSKANSAYIVAAQPNNILALIQDMRRAMEEDER